MSDRAPANPRAPDPRNDPQPLRAARRPYAPPALTVESSYRETAVGKLVRDVEIGFTTGQIS